MLINDYVNFKGMERTALICIDKVKNSNKYYILQLEETKDGKFKVTFKYGRRGKNPRIITNVETSYSSACTIYNSKIKHLKNVKNYVEVNFFDIMENDTSAFFNLQELEIIN